MTRIRHRSIAALLVSCSLLLAGCTTTGPKQTQGALVGGLGGAAMGAVVGNAVGGRDGAILGTVIGAAIGAGIGSEIGRELDERDRALRQAALDRAFAQRTARVGSRQTWSNSVTHNRGEVVLLRTYQENNKTCNVYSEAYDKNSVGQSFSQQHTPRCFGPDGFVD
jgi:surface antigen